VLVRETADSVWVKDDRETNAIECLVMTANMVARSRIFIRSCSRWWLNWLWRFKWPAYYVGVACSKVVFCEEGARPPSQRGCFGW